MIDSASKRHGGKRTGAGRRTGTINKTPWAVFMRNVETVTRTEFPLKKLRELAQADPWRFLEKIALKVALPSVEITVRNETNQGTLPLIFIDEAPPLEGEYTQQILEKSLNVNFLPPDRYNE